MRPFHQSLVGWGRPGLDHAGSEFRAKNHHWHSTRKLKEEDIKTAHKDENSHVMRYAHEDTGPYTRFVMKVFTFIISIAGCCL